MLPKALLTRALIKTVLIGSGLSLALFFSFIQSNSNLSASGQSQNISEPLVENNVTLPKEEQINFGLPVRLKIPEINVDSAVEYVGLDSDGAMDTPKSQDNVAWYELGQRPGENGSAVIAGHYGGKASAFDNLYKLRKGDKLYIEDDKGVTVSFVVRENRRYDPEADASNVFNSNDGKSHLNLVTCEGDWDKDSKSYDKRLVVFTDKE